MSHRSYPKEGKKKQNEIIKHLKDQIKERDKRIRTLENELVNLTKPVRTRKPQKEELTHEEWRRDFIKRVKNKE